MLQLSGSQVRPPCPDLPGASAAVRPPGLTTTHSGATLGVTRAPSSGHHRVSEPEADTSATSWSLSVEDPLDGKSNLRTRRWSGPPHARGDATHAAAYCRTRI